MRLEREIATSQQQLRGVVNELIDCSQWFSVEPLPEDCYEIVVKAENGQLLRQLILNHEVIRHG